MIFDIKCLQHKIGERNFLMLCDPSSPLEEIKAALAHFMGMMMQIEESLKEPKNVPGDPPVMDTSAQEQ